MTSVKAWDSNSSEEREDSIKKLTRTLLEKRVEPKGKPRLLLAVIGDSSSFVPKPWITPVLQLGLVETAKGAKDCLILYKGSEEKISSLVWEAVDDFRVMNNTGKDHCFITLVGLGFEGEGRKLRVKTEESKKHVVDKYFEIVKKNRNPGYQADLEIQERDADIYQKFHADFLANIASEYVPFEELGDEHSLTMKLPVLVIVAEGDLQTIHHVLHVIKKDIPVLILQGSGKAADLIAECMEDTASVETKAPLLLGIYFQEKDFTDLTKKIDEISNHKHFVNIFNMNEQDETQFSDAVVNAIIRAWAHSRDKTSERVVKSAVSRKRNKMKVEASNPDEEKYIRVDQEICELEGTSTSTRVMANGFIGGGRNSVQPLPNPELPAVSTVTRKNVNVKGQVKEVMEYYQNSLTPASLPLYFYIAYQFIQEMHTEDREEKTKSFQILLRQAMIADRVDYVKVLLQEEKVEFDRQQLPNVYEQTIDCGCIIDGDCQHVMSILKSASTTSTKKLVKKRKIKELTDKRKVVNNYQKCLQSGRQLCQKFLHYPRKKYKKKDLRDNNKDDKNEEEIRKLKKEMYQDLLIWALFANRRELATLFWTKCENQLLTAILASCVLNRMAGRAKSGKDQFLYNSIKEHSSIFEKRASDLQTKLYAEDPELAMDLLLTEQTVWDISVSPLECAFDNAMLDFIAHSCAQRRLNKIWYKKIGANLGDYWKKGFFCGCHREGKGEERALLLRKFIYAPLTRFLVHYIIFIAALVCYSAFLLIELSEYKGAESIKIYEWLIYVWLLGDILEEYRGVLPWNNEVIRSRFSRKKEDENALSQSVKYRLVRYFYDFWNFLDFVCYCITLAAVLVRFLHESKTATLARRLYSLSLFTMYMRFLHALLMSRKLGPKIIMIKEMLKDLFRFIGILFIFMVGVGVLYHANMYPAHVDMWNTDGWTYWRIWKIIYIPYWQIYGELFLDVFEANSTQPCTTNESEWESNGEIERCNQYDWVLIVIAALYMLISNLLLVNLVIALFSYRFEIVQANSERLWRYWRYAVVMDYRTRVPAPLNLVIRPFISLAKCIRKCAKKKDESDPTATKRMERLQDISANKCIRKLNEC